MTEQNERLVAGFGPAPGAPPGGEEACKADGCDLSDLIPGHAGSSAGRCQDGNGFAGFASGSQLEVDGQVQIRQWRPLEAEGVRSGNAIRVQSRRHISGKPDCEFVIQR